MKVRCGGDLSLRPRLATVTRFDGAGLQTLDLKNDNLGSFCFIVFSSALVRFKTAVCDLVRNGRGVNQWLRISNDALVGRGAHGFCACAAVEGVDRSSCAA